MAKDTLASHAADNAQIAAKSAADSAIVIATVANDVSWMKDSLKSIEAKLDDMSKSFVTYGEHSDVVKKIDDHEERLNRLEDSNTTNILLVRVGIAILSVLVGLLVYHIFKTGV